jgi:hypothetical protein
MLTTRSWPRSRRRCRDPVARRLGYALERAQHALRVSTDEALRPLALTTPQYSVLCAVEAEPGLSNARLARAAFVTAQTMQAILANLERDGLLVRCPDPAHGRAGQVRGRPSVRPPRRYASMTAVTSARASCLMHQAKWPSRPSAVKALLVARA